MIPRFTTCKTMIAVVLTASALLVVKPAFAENILYLKCHVTGLADGTIRVDYDDVIKIDLDNGLIWESTDGRVDGPGRARISAEVIEGEIKVAGGTYYIGINRITGSINEGLQGSFGWKGTCQKVDVRQF